MWYRKRYLPGGWRLHFEKKLKPTDWVSQKEWQRRSLPVLKTTFSNWRLSLVSDEKTCTAEKYEKTSGVWSKSRVSVWSKRIVWHCSETSAKIHRKFWRWWPDERGCNIGMSKFSWDSKLYFPWLCTKVDLKADPDRFGQSRICNDTLTQTKFYSFTLI